MEPKQRTERSAYPGGPMVGVKSVNDTTSGIGDDFNLNDTNNNLDSYLEGGGLKFDDDNAPEPEDVEKEEQEVKKMTDEEIKIKALNQAINVAKLMSDIDTDAVIDIAKKLAKFIKG